MRVKGERAMKLNKNAEGYHDPTPYQTLLDENRRENDVNRLIHTLKYIISLSEFELAERIVLKDKSGRVYR